MTAPKGGIPEGVRDNFETLRKAFLNGDVALLQCTDRVTGMPAYLVCAVNIDAAAEDGESPYQFVPMAVMDHELYVRMSPPGDVHSSTGRN